MYSLQPKHWCRRSHDGRDVRKLRDEPKSLARKSRISEQGRRVTRAPWLHADRDRPTRHLTDRVEDFSDGNTAPGAEIKGNVLATPQQVM
jgi:hypothetical protein